MKAALPIGIEDFEVVRREGLYYIDKTGLIRELLKKRSYVTLFTRPRRFGKSLNMSMLKHFFQAGGDSTLFDGLEISAEKELCEKYMGKFPVISISLKGAEGENFEEAKGMLRAAIGREALKFQFLLQSRRLTEIERRQYRALVNVDEKGAFTMGDESLKDSLLTLSGLLHKHYGQKAIILIDEYDVPLEKAYHSNHIYQDGTTHQGGSVYQDGTTHQGGSVYQGGNMHQGGSAWQGDNSDRGNYYDAMVKLLRGLFGQALKSNDSLYFAVLTGCLRISRESIFTGFNNFSVYTMQDVRYKEYFGFTDAEVREMLAYYGFMDQYYAVKEWYDGYRFGNLSIYCPWDVLNYCDRLRDGGAAEPQNYWVNTSGNDIIRKFVSKANAAVRKEIEELINGGSVRKTIRQELTYRDIDFKIDHLWSILYTTGYLTQRGTGEGRTAELVIPNREIRWIFTEQIQEWFEEETVRDSKMLENFCGAFLKNDTAAIEEGFSAYLRKTISIRDTNVKKDMKENFYHGILLGIFGHRDNWDVMSNAESGEGYSDIAVEDAEKGIGFVIELKYAENGAFDTQCRKALQQIKTQNYEEVLIRDGMKTIYRYGIACYKKHCKVISG